MPAEELLPQVSTEELSFAVVSNIGGRRFFCGFNAEDVLPQEFMEEGSSIVLTLSTEELSSMHSCGRSSSVGVHRRTFFCSY